eukprot:CAMPEP_0184495358 /NCGR_PEP_ID=MMETSP0113_2-20130426/31071_1 /TAXON_ID=91329 /ORGANISM="Norrisiella sphaerica, Strain BC52" /LENGTH=375 /DNA_ID=CAMNT_0026881515 /DNA_START=73 /DNA_END=1196 /DNA_ORIENTATION=-
MFSEHAGIPDDVRVAIEGSSGGIGNAVGLLSTYPLTVIKTRLQAQRKKTERNGVKANGHQRKKKERNGVKANGHHGSSKANGESHGKHQKEEGEEMYKGPLDCVRQVLRNEGVGGLYAGVALKVCETYMWNSTFYTFFSLLKPVFREKGALNKVLHGMLAGMGTQLVLFPLVGINTGIVTRRKKATVANGSPGSPRACSSADSSHVLGWINEYSTVIREIYDEGGIFAFWKGISAGLLLTINPGILTLIRTRLTEFASARRIGNKSNSMDDFWIGFTSKLLASTITYPLVVARSQIVTGKKSELEFKFAGSASSFSLISIIRGIALVLRTMQRVIEQRGFAGLYAGVMPHLSQAALKEAIANTIRRRVTLILFSL